MRILPLGTIVRLKEGTEKLMVTSRLPLCNHNGKIGYLDYGACIYPQGQISPQSFFFNDEDIEEICFEGYRDEKEEKSWELCTEQVKDIKYPRFTIREIE